VYGLAAWLYHEQCFAFERAFALHQSWVARHPGDLPAQVNFAETHFTTERFSEGVQRIRELLTKPPQSSGDGVKGRSTLTTSTRAVMLVLLAANRIALSDAEKAQATRAALTRQIQDQPSDFRIVCSWRGTRHFIEQTRHPPIVNGRAWLLQLITAAEGENRDEILQRLDELSPPKD
jgi:hypothetical protein